MKTPDMLPKPASACYLGPRVKVIRAIFALPPFNYSWVVHLIASDMLVYDSSITVSVHNGRLYERF